MFRLNVPDIKRKFWLKYLPWLSLHGASRGIPYDYFSVFFKDVDNTHYALDSIEKNKNTNQESILLTPLPHGVLVKKNIHEIIEMEPEIIHFKVNYSLNYKSIFAFAIDHHLKIITLKTIVSRIKGNIVSGLKSDVETISSDRYHLLRLLVAQHVNQRPSRASSGFCIDEVISLLYGTLWYKHIKNESFRRRIKLLLESLVITGDLSEKDEVYFVQGQSVTTLVEYEKEEKRAALQQKMHKNIVRFMLVITIATLLIIMVLLAMAGIVDLHAIWQKIIQIKPVRFLLKII